MVWKVYSVRNEEVFVNAGIGNTPLLSMVLSMLPFTVKYGTGCLYLNNCAHGLESFLYLKLYNTMIVIDFSQGWQFLPLSGNFRKKLRKKWKGRNTFFRGRNGRNGRNEIKS